MSTTVTPAPSHQGPPPPSPPPVAPPAPEPVNPNAGYENHIPRSIRALSQKADELHRQATQEAAGQTAGPPGAASPPRTTPQFSTQVANAPPAEIAPVANPAGDQSWEQRYLSLKGKYDAEVPAAQRAKTAAEQQAQHLTWQIGQLNQQVQGLLQAQQQRPAPAPTPAPAADFSEDVTTYGQEIIDRSRAWARAEIAPEIETLKQQLATVQRSTQQVTQQSTAQSVQSYMDANMPSWRRQNDDANFVAWLQAPNVYSEHTKHWFLGEAYTKGNAQRVLAIFQEYAREHTAPEPEPEPAPIPAQQPTGVNLADLASPGRGRPVAPGNGAPAPKRRWTRAQITAFYSAKARGHYARNPAEADAIDRDINQAGFDGRIDP